MHMPVISIIDLFLNNWYYSLYLSKVDHYWIS